MPLAFAISLVVACTEEPILTGLEPQGGVPASMRVDAGPEAPLAPPEPGPYQRPEGVLVDVSWLAGRSWDAARDQVSVQMGDIQAIHELDPRDGTEYVLEQGAVRVLDGVIYMVRVDLPRPMRRSTALFTAGLPTQVSRWYDLSDEWRLRWHAGFERIRVGKENRESEMAVWVEAMKWNPRTGRGR
ncbi:MAG: hypothetical protein H6739_05210 [Alphaproteobacteria bacterium]|nr:hypothetical protein [Alphaproteobacteria bacterium]